VSTLLDLAAANDDLEVLQIGKSGRSNVSQWLEEWDIDQAKKGAFLKSVADAYEKTGDS
jgi:translation initiation factor 3 subunit M